MDGLEADDGVAEAVAGIEAGWGGAAAMKYQADGVPVSVFYYCTYSFN